MYSDTTNIIQESERVYDFRDVIPTEAVADTSDTSHIKDSGKRRKFESGAVRDIVKGKGPCDLVPLSSAAIIIFSSYSPVPDVDHMKRNVERYVLEVLDEYMIRYDEWTFKSEEYLSRAVQIFSYCTWLDKGRCFLRSVKAL